MGSGFPGDQSDSPQKPGPGVLINAETAMPDAIYNKMYNNVIQKTKKIDKLCAQGIILSLESRFFTGERKWQSVEHNECPRETRNLKISVI